MRNAKYGKGNQFYTCHKYAKWNNVNVPHNPSQNNKVSTLYCSKWVWFSLRWCFPDGVPIKWSSSVSVDQ